MMYDPAGITGLIGDFCGLNGSLFHGGTSGEKNGGNQSYKHGIHSMVFLVEKTGTQESRSRQVSIEDLVNFDSH
jgi:hypothetical protein